MGLKKSEPEYKTWASMRSRCRDSSRRAYAGISVCPEWNDFEVFLRDMGPKPSPRHSIDRIDNRGGYSKANCRWATPKEQSANLRWTRRHVVYGKSLTNTEISEQFGILRGTVCDWANRLDEKSMHDRIADVLSGKTVLKKKRSA